MPDALIFDHVRTPRGKGKVDGSLHPITPIQLAAQTLAAIRIRSDLDTGLVDDVVLGCVSPIGEQGGNIARIANLVAGFDQSVPGKQLNRFCASGLEAVNTAAAQIMSGQSALIIAGGVESMSRVPMGSDGGSWMSDPSVAYQTYFAAQGVSADLIATLDGITREAADQWALASQQRAKKAWESRLFSNSIVLVRDVIGRVVLDHDEYMRPQTTIEDLAALRPSFTGLGEQGFDSVAIQRYPEVEMIHHIHTAGNSSGIVDGASGVLLGTAKMGRKIGRRARARIVGFASVGSEPTIMLTGPAEAARRVLKRARRTIADVDLFEINEAFASVVLRYIREFELDPDRVNVNGGAIAMGHPLGATGAMILGMAIDELERRDLQTALVALCVGAGMGTATLIERI